MGDDGFEIVNGRSSPVSKERSGSRRKPRKLSLARSTKQRATLND